MVSTVSNKPRHIKANLVSDIHGLALIGLVIALLIGVVMGYTIASAKYNSPYHLSIKSTDYAFILEASGIANSNGQCIRLITLEGDEPNKPIYWLTSCNPDQ